ncbi:hypothetical protein OKE68_11340 [Riemerella anatipestifer]|uniref:Uncharacterized protein n=2 Tax=Riemerella anatipestifer TaxID=34085 RepID=A0A1S7DU71_RIEAN|nr:hypothetical protein [Riemerella anatipestifer]AQY22665.1 hypothetical protein AB406_1722 [Riemerella anatipestifer]MBT0574239.1 hypothetical protein [Riemerella anatipestifer]MCU7569354.1 hypothetical protein [Riemerella anatipestifer]MCW0491370.1 hypothetical protein [Riemerella anatipestifer]MCW0524900.1 hypothetical protein [Riemerella anatipestifer]
MVIENTPDNIFREIRNVEIYRASDVKFTDIISRSTINAVPLIVMESIIPEDFNKNIKKKYTADNEYYDIDINYSLYTDSANLNSLSELLGKRKFAIKLITNVDKLWLGNDREPLTIDLQDGNKDDNSGNDKHEVSIYGTTILKPSYVL